MPPVGQDEDIQSTPRERPATEEVVTNPERATPAAVETAQLEQAGTVQTPANDPTITSRLQLLKETIARLERDGAYISPAAKNLEMLTPEQIAMDPSLMQSLDQSLQETGAQDIANNAANAIGGIAGAAVMGQLLSSSPGVMNSGVAGMANAAGLVNLLNEQQEQKENNGLVDQNGVAAAALVGNPNALGGIAVKGGPKGTAALQASQTMEPQAPKLPDFAITGLSADKEPKMSAFAVKLRGMEVGGMPLASNMQEASESQFFAGPGVDIAPLDHGLGARVSEGRAIAQEQGQGQGRAMVRSLRPV